MVFTTIEELEELIAEIGHDGVAARLLEEVFTGHPSSATAQQLAIVADAGSWAWPVGYRFDQLAARLTAPAPAA